MIRNKKILTGLSHEQYEHPFDKKALAALEKPIVDLLPNPIPVIGKFITSNWVEKIFNVQYTGSNLKVTKDNYPQIYEYLEYACEILDVKNKPELYIQWGYDINAFTVGADNPIIVLNSGLIDLCDEDEIMFIIGHELGHIKSNHMLYHMMAQSLNQIISMMGPIASAITMGAQYVIYYWYRMSEFTADRAGLMCCQDEDAMVRAFMKMAGIPKSHFNQMNKDTFIQQARDFKALDYESMNKLIKTVAIADDTHPWTVMRAAELLKWIREGEYGKFVK